MSVDYDAFVLVGATVDQLGLNIDDVTNAKEFEYEEYLAADDTTYTAICDNAYVGARGDNTFIGILLTNETEFENVKLYKEYFNKSFGKNIAKTHIEVRCW